MESGYYRLTQDIINPHPDGRRKRDLNSQKIWPAGMKVEAKFYAEHLPVIYFRDHSQIILTDKPEEGDGYVLASTILPFLSKEPATVSTLVAGSTCDYDDLLAYLVESGTLSIEQLAKAVKDFEEWDEEKYTELRRKHL